MTIDEGLSRLETDLRHLKIEYETYFTGGSPRPPNDLVFRVEKIIKIYNIGASEMSFRQRFRFNQLTQSYAVHSDLWRKKMKMKEEGADSPGQRSRLPATAKEFFRTSWSDPDCEKGKVEELLHALVHAKSSAGELTEGIDPERFAEFIREKTTHFKQSLACDHLGFSVRVEDGRVKLCVEKAST